MKTYQFTVEEGNLVYLPGGVLGIVNKVDIICAGNVKEVSIYPFVNFIHRFWLFITGRTLFYDEQINRLQRLSV